MGQADPAPVRPTESAFGIDNDDRKAHRAHIQAQPIDPGADAWQHGKKLQIATPAGAELEVISD